MRIKELEVTGFKSFVDRIKLNFNPGITALVGPNGCGKSNVIDAMRWIMGEHNARQLRGTKMEDLIFNGSESRKATGMAEVSITLSNGDGNGGRLFSNASEIMVTRRLFRSGESEYFINKVPCRLKDIVEMFLDSGVGTKSYSIMEQGKVDFILSLKPDERRILIEEAAGISKYRSRKKEALSKMGSTKNNLLRLKDVLNELQIQMRTLDLQVKRLKRHRNIKGEIKQIDLTLASHRLEQLTKANQQYTEKLTNHKDEEIHLSTRKSTTEANLEQDRLNLTELNKKIEQLQHNSYAAKETIQNEENIIQLNEQELSNTSDTINKSNRNLEDLMNELSNIDAEIVSGEQNLGIKKTEIENLQSKVNSAYENLAAAKDRLKDFQGKIELTKGDLFKAAHEMTELKNAILLNRRLQEEISLKLKKVSGEKENCNNTLHELEEKRALLEGDINDLIKLIDHKEADIRSVRIKIDNLSEAFQQKEAGSNEMKDRIGTLRARLQSLLDLQKNLEGFEEGVRTIMNGVQKKSTDFNGIVCLLADIIETAPQFEQVVEAVLDMKLQAVIVESLQDGLNSIEQLKRSKKGRVSFIPLTLRKIEIDQFDIQPAVPLLSVVNTRRDYQPVIEALLGDVLLVDDISQALEVWNRNHSKYTIATKDGEIIEPEGIITGGSTNGSSSGILKRNREIKEFSEELNQIESLFQVLVKEKDSLAEDLQINKKAYEDLADEKQELENKLFRLKTNIEQAQKELLAESEKADLLGIEESQSNASLSEYQQELEQLIESEVRQQQIEEQKRNGLTELQQKELVLKGELENSEAGHTDLRVGLVSAQKELENVLSNYSRLAENKEICQSKIVASKQEIESLENKTETITIDIDSSRDRLKELIDQGRTLDVQIDEEKSKARALEDAVNSGDNSLKALRARWEEIEPEIHDIDKKLSETSIHIEHLANDISEKYSQSIDQLPPPPDPESFNEDESKERLEKLHKRLENIGDVNLGAAKEFEELEERFQFLCAQEEDLLQAINSLQKVISKINSITKQKFSDTFNAINEHFRQLFPLLFNGGKAYMKLTDESDLLETGVDVFAQPPGKKLQSLDLLSGGERALTVIALMFSIFLTKPSPFCLMDEIDAPLDDSNIGRFITHLQKMAKHSQFIIVTHNKLSMQAADCLYGITMEEQGVSKVVSVAFN